ncbi:MAG: HAMP domain-containing histidine kinase [Lachnospiraceae bacterium]|nr:HAMP domain-containing histidine kinase [Lachnospiraceae bacterium]
MKNKELRNMIIIGAACTLLFVLCGSLFFGIKEGLLLLVLGILLIGIYSFFTIRRYRKIEKLNDYLVQVLAGAEKPSLDDQEEGELSLLRTNIYKATSTLQYQKEILADDKKQLAVAMADISHQLKTPLTSLMVMNDLLQEEENEEKRREFIKTQSSQLDRMNWLIQTLLKLSKLDAGTIELKKEDVAAEELIEEAVKPFAIQFDIRNMKLKTDITKALIRCDKNWTVEALQNIIKNCMEHMDEGGVLSVAANDTNIYSEIVIRDTGCGIAKEDLSHVFERFYKGKNAGKDSVGIGLALSKSIVEGQQGEILVNSEEGIGTKFVIKLYKTII